ncbi:MAG: hypothetical protein ACK5LC_08715, partial [Coprobacillaceae bacterium]
ADKKILLNPIKKQKKLHQGYLYLLLSSIVILVIGIFLDSYNQKEIPLDNTFPTLSDFGFKKDSDIYDVMNVKESFLIPYSYSYIEQSGEVSDEDYGNLLSIRYYELKDENTTNSFVSNIIDYPELMNAKEIVSINKDNTVYLAYSKTENIADTMILTKDQKIVIIATSFDLSNPEYQEIIYQYYQP